jgi:hypothetical protein
MITSDRNFGIEIEFFCNTRQGLHNIQEMYNIVDDGSIRHINYAGEYVSGILQGKEGQEHIEGVCEVLKKNGARGDNPSMSVHVHLDGRKNDNEVHLSVEKPTEYKDIIRISDKLSRSLKSSFAKTALTRGYYDTHQTMEQKVIDGVLHLSLARLTSLPTKNFTYAYTKENNRFEWLRNMMYFYTQYSQVMEDIVSNSRKFGNMYCIPLGDSYELSDIEAVKNEGELATLWYKGNGSSGHYDDSRYHNVNFHSYWDRHGTVEIRSHGGTVDPHKILLWVKLHQKIADKLETMELKDIKPKTPNLHQEFLNFVEEPLLQNYVKRLMGYYSGIKIK